MSSINKIIFVRAAPFYPDSRLEKEIESIREAGYDVSLLAWDRRTYLKDVSVEYKVYRIPLRAPVGKPTILFWPIWWILEFLYLINLKCDVIHVADFNSYLPALVAAKLKGKKIIYDIYDFCADTAPFPKVIRDIVYFIDTKAMNYADKIIIVDYCRLKQIGREGDEQICIIYNSPNDSDTTSHKTRDRKVFNIFYGGIHQPDRDIVSMAKIAEEIPDINVTIAGGGDQNIIKNIINISNSTTNVQHIGIQPYSEILKYSQNSDLLFALYDPENRNNKLASPNKLFEAMMCGKPIIVNEGVATADKVREENCGLVVPYGDYEALKEAVLLLKNNPELCKELGENGRRAYETKYNWKIMEKRLLDLYASLEAEQ